MTIKFHKAIYTKKAIGQAISDFRNVADFKITDSSDYYMVEATEIDKDVKGVIKDELSNYVLYAMKQGNPSNGI